MVEFVMREAAERRVERHRRRQFERLVARALDELPDDVLAMLDNVDVVVEDEPSADQIAVDRARDHGRGPGSDDDEPESLFGLYQGIPLVDRGQGYSMVLPDKITIFRGPLERACRSRQELMREVRITVVHELGHHLGLDEDRLEELGWA